MTHSIGSDGVITDPEQLTSHWLAEVLGRPVGTLTVSPVGTGQIGTCFRLVLGDGDRLIVKLPAADAGLRQMLAGAYAGEVRFYAQLAPTVDVRVPRLHHAAMAPGTGDFTLLLEDLAPWRQGDQIAGCTPGQVHEAVVNLARLHGPRWCDPSLLDVEGLSVNGADDAALLAEFYAPATQLFIDGVGPLLAPGDDEVLGRCAEVIERWALARAATFGLVHGDYRLDNLLFPAAEPRSGATPTATPTATPGDTPGVCAVDWQTISLALPARDLAYVIASSLSPQERRAHEKDLVTSYYQILSRYGVEHYSFADCWDDYRFGMLQGPLVSVLGCAYGNRTERGDQMFAAMVRRFCAALRDLDSLGLIPA
jgi:Phosphotransferase enzyme family